MKVLLIHQAFVSPQEAGGTRHYEFARQCVAKGHAFTIVASSLSYLTGRQTVTGKKRLVSEQDMDGVRVLRAYTYPSLHRSFVWRIVTFISFMLTSVWAGLKAGPVDVVMGTSPPIFQAVSAWVVAFVRRRPFLLEIRDLWPEFGIDMGVLTNPILIRLARWLERFLYNRAAHFIVNSPAYRDYLAGKGIPEDKISLIANGVDPAMFDPTDRGEAIRQEFGLGEKFVATYAGALGQANDIPTILRAAEKLQGETAVHILLVGDGKERANLEQLASDLHLHNITFTGSRPKAQMKDFLAASDVGLATLLDIPMFRTTYPNKVFDYMAAGRATVLGIDGVIREVIEAAGGGVFVPPGNADELAKALRSLTQKPVETEMMGRAARAYVERHFNRQEQAQQFMNLVESFAADHTYAPTS
ncbi:MAG: glycosyltransferase family 4 protein [Anaerolineales bacterium]|nr:glycosyltransferase family 4 protein [Anaerolineales bacterium]